MDGSNSSGVEKREQKNSAKTYDLLLPKNTQKKPSLEHSSPFSHFHLPQTLSQIIHHFPLMKSPALPFSLLEHICTSKDSFILLGEDTLELETGTPITFSPSLDLALAAALAAARYVGKVAVILVPTTTLARKINFFLQQAFGLSCRVATTNSSLSEEVSCELFADAQIILGTYSSFLRKLLTKDLPSFHTIVFFHPLSQQYHSQLTTILFDLLLLRLTFSSRGSDSLKKIFVCDSRFSSIKDYQLLTNCLNSFSLENISPKTISSSFSLEQQKSFQSIFLPMLGLLFRRHLSRKQLFQELQTSYVHRYFQTKAIHKNQQKADSSLEAKKRFFKKQTYQTFVLLSHPSLGPFKFIERSSNRYTLTSFGEEFLLATTYSSSSLEDIIHLILFLISANKEQTLCWETLQHYLLDSFPVKQAYSSNQSFNHLLSFIQQIREIFDSLPAGVQASLPPKKQTKLSQLLKSQKFSFGDFQQMKFLNCIGQQFANESLTPSLKAIEQQMLKSFFGRKSKRKKYNLYNHQKVQELLITELLSSNKPQTVSQAALALNIDKQLTDRVLRSFAREQEPLIIARTVTTALGRRTLFGPPQSFPEYFEYTCADCQFYTVTGTCSVFTTLGRLAPHKIPSEYRPRAEKVLAPGTIPCWLFSQKELRNETLSLEDFAELSREVTGLSDRGTTFKHTCIYCSNHVAAFGSDILPKIGISTISCGYCGSLFKLSRKKQGKKGTIILVECQEGNRNTFVNVLYELSGMLWDEHTKELTPLHGMTVRLGENIHLQDSYLIIENVSKKIDDLDYLYSSIPLPPAIEKALEEKNIQLRYNPIACKLKEHTREKTLEEFTQEQCLALLALRETCLLTNPFLQANIYSRWAVTNRLFLLLNKRLSEEDVLITHLFDFEWRFLDILLLARNVHHPYTSRLCEGLAGNLMWSFLKVIFNSKNLALFTRVRERYTKEKRFYPSKRTLAYSAASVLTNFFLLLVQDRLKALHLQEKLPWKGARGFFHSTKKASILDKMGFFLDFNDVVKIAALYFITKAIMSQEIGFADVEEVLAPSGATLYAVKFQAIPKLERLIDDFFSQKIWHSTQEMTLEEAYCANLRSFFSLLEVIADALAKTVILFKGKSMPAIEWLDCWEEFSFIEQKLLVKKLQPLLSKSIANKSFFPLQYLPTFLAEKCQYVSKQLPSLEEFRLFHAWEKEVLEANNIQNFHFQEKQTAGDVND